MKILNFLLILTLAALVSCVTDDGKDPDVLVDRFDEDVASPVPSSNKASAPAGLENIDNGVQQTIKDQEKEIALCYVRALERKPNTKGNLSIQWDITDKGKAKNIVVTKNETGSLSLASCLTELTEDLTFPSAPKGKTTKAEYPYSFALPKSK